MDADLDTVRKIDTLIIGAGPSGLAAAFKLSKAGFAPLILEKGETAGGLMRSFRRGDFVVDIGRKELYSRIPEVDRLWHDILGDNYRHYAHRVGSLYRGRILEMSPEYLGYLRGLPWSWLLVGGFDLLLNWISLCEPSNYEDYWYRRVGRHFSRLFAQGYWEKFRGHAWANMPVPKTEIDGKPVNSYSLNAIKQGLILASQGGPSSQKKWHHPAKGTGQICEIMLREILKQGGEVRFKTKVCGIVGEKGLIGKVLTDEGVIYEPRFVVSSMQIEELDGILSDSLDESPKLPEDGDLESNRTIVLVYLFLNEPPKFPHAWLEINDPDVKAGRITSYAAFNGDMVPDGQACLCVEYFCVGDDPILKLSEKSIVELAVKECADSNLIDRGKLLDAHLLMLKRSNAAASWRDWQTPFRMQLQEEIMQFENLFHVNRPGTDWATFAGLMAAEAILQGQRAEFDRRADPRRRYSPTQ